MTASGKIYNQLCPCMSCKHFAECFKPCEAWQDWRPKADQRFLDAFPQFDKRRLRERVITCNFQFEDNDDGQS